MAFLEFLAFGSVETPDRPEMLKELAYTALHLDTFAKEGPDISEDPVRSTLFIRPKDTGRNQRNDPFIVTKEERDLYGNYESLPVPDIETTIHVLGSIAQAYVGATQLPKP